MATEAKDNVSYRLLNRLSNLVICARCLSTSLAHSAQRPKCADSVPVKKKNLSKPTSNQFMQPNHMLHS